MTEIVHKCKAGIVITVINVTILWHRRTQLKEVQGLRFLSRFDLRKKKAERDERLFFLIIFKNK
jgi:hypothetical protein